MEINLCMGCMKKIEGAGPCPFCGFSREGYIPKPYHLPPETVLHGKYLIGKVIGEGGFGITYIGWDLDLEIRIAVKEYFPEGLVTRNSAQSLSAFLGNHSGLEHYRQGREKFIKEARALAKLDDTPGIVRIKDYFQENNTAYIVMEYLDGITLKKYVEKEGGRLAAPRVLEMVYPVMAALDEAHRAGILHRDISPDNIMVLGNGKIKLLDFGTAKDLAADGGRQSRAVMLKPGYAPPEQYRVNAKLGPYTDVYALCATIYYCLTGSAPQESLDRCMGGNPELSPPGPETGLCREQGRILMKGLSVDPGERYQTMGELFEAMTKAAVSDELKKYTGRSVAEERESFPGNKRPEETGGKSPRQKLNSSREKSRGGRVWKIAAVCMAAMLCFVFYRFINEGKMAGNGNGISTQAGSEDDAAKEGAAGIGDKGDGSVGRPKEPGRSGQSGEGTKTPGKMKYYGALAANIADGSRYLKRGGARFVTDRNDRLFRIGGGKSVKLADSARYLNYMNGVIYYRDQEDGHIYSIPADGTDTAKQVGDMRAPGGFSVVDEWIYYVDERANPWRMPVTGVGETRLGEQMCEALQIDDGWLYYIDLEEDRHICRMRPDGTGVETVYAWPAVDFCAAEGKLYVIGEEAIYRTEPDGSDLVTVISREASAVNAYDGWIYYVDRKDGFLWRAEQGAEEAQLIYNEAVLPKINIEDNNLYFIKKAGYKCGQPFLCSLDGRSGVNLTGLGEIRGNTPGNNVNYGTAVADGNGVLYGMLLDGSLYKDVMEDPALLAFSSWEINIIDDQCYYVREENSKEAVICQASLDDMDNPVKRVEITTTGGEIAIRYFSVVDDVFYYGLKRNDFITLYRLGPEDDSARQLSKDNCWSVNVSEGFIYYLEGKNGLPYRIKTDGSGKKSLYGEAARSLVVDDGMIYMALRDTIISMRPDGSGIRKIKDASASSLNVAGGWIYYTDANDGESLKRVSVDGTVASVVCGDGVKWVNTVYDLIYYWDTVDQTPYLSLSDGSEWMALEVKR